MRARLRLMMWRAITLSTDPYMTVLFALRNETRLRRLVYVSCNPESMAANCAELCTPQVGTHG